MGLDIFKLMNIGMTFEQIISFQIKLYILLLVVVLVLYLLKFIIKKFFPDFYEILKNYNIF